MRSSSSLANAGCAIASTTSGAIEPASIALRTAVSNSRTEGAPFSLTIASATMTGSVAAWGTLRDSVSLTITP